MKRQYGTRNYKNKVLNNLKSFFVFVFLHSIHLSSSSRLRIPRRRLEWRSSSRTASLTLSGRFPRWTAPSLWGSGLSVHYDTKDTLQPFWELSLKCPWPLEKACPRWVGLGEGEWLLFAGSVPSDLGASVASSSVLNPMMSLTEWGRSCGGCTTRKTTSNMRCSERFGEFNRVMTSITVHNNPSMVNGKLRTIRIPICFTALALGIDDL